MGIEVDYEQRWEELKQADAGKQKLVEDLIGEVTRLTGNLEDTKNRLERQEELSDLYHKRFRDTESQLQNKQRQMVRAVLIKFLDHIVKDISSGGRMAAQLLRHAVLEYISAKIPFLPQDLEVVVKIYGNMKGLCRIYCDAKIVDQREDFESFLRAFNMSHPSCDFIDAGHGKECSDDKIRGVFKLHVGDVHCKHIIFGGSADNGYARMLAPYAGNEKINRRVTMLEGPPFAQELSQLVQKFGTCSFPAVFRSTKIPPRRVSFSATPPGSPSPKLGSWASAVAIGAAAASTFERAPVDLQRINGSKDSVLRNSKGQRVDPPLVVSPNLVNVLKARKLCNFHHLAGHCPYGNYGDSTVETKTASQATNVSQLIAMETTVAFQMRCTMWIRELLFVDDIGKSEGGSQSIVNYELRRKSY
ncbi:MAG: hypothetical protein Q9191_007191 [Dirinaria sp. TL-2023a]